MISMVVMVSEGTENTGYDLISKFANSSNDETFDTNLIHSILQSKHLVDTMYSQLIRLLNVIPTEEPLH